MGKKKNQKQTSTHLYRIYRVCHKTSFSLLFSPGEFVCGKHGFSDKSIEQESANFVSSTRLWYLRLCGPYCRLLSSKNVKQKTKKPYVVHVPCEYRLQQDLATGRSFLTWSKTIGSFQTTPFLHF